MSLDDANVGDNREKFRVSGVRAARQRSYIRKVEVHILSRSREDLLRDDPSLGPEPPPKNKGQPWTKTLLNVDFVPRLPAFAPKTDFGMHFLRQKMCVSDKKCALRPTPGSVFDTQHFSYFGPSVRLLFRRA